MRQFRPDQLVLVLFPAAVKLAAVDDDMNESVGPVRNVNEVSVTAEISTALRTS